MDLTLIDKYKALGIASVIDHEKFSNISIVHHSTVIEGSTLTEVEAQVLIEEGLTPQGKPLSHSLMVTDHFAALKFALEEAAKKRTISLAFIQELNSLIVRNTGLVYNTVFGQVDARKGEFRKGNVTAGNTYFPNYDKVVPLLKSMVDKITDMMKRELSLAEQVNLSFDAHYNLVSIHPFYDGNGRVSRLLMNYIQAYYQLPLAMVRHETKAEYIQALINAREQEDVELFREFMGGEYTKLLKDEIERFEQMKSPKKDKGFNLLF